VQAIAWLSEGSSILRGERKERAAVRKSGYCHVGVPTNKWCVCCEETVNSDQYVRLIKRLLKSSN
jgi:hypothetical protein